MYLVASMSNGLSLLNQVTLFLKSFLERALENIEKFNPFVFGYGGKGVLNVMGPTYHTLAIRSISSFPNEQIC